MYRTAPFQNPATARTAGSCERTGAAKAPVLSPAIFLTGRFTLDSGGSVFQQSSLPSVTRCRQELKICSGGHIDAAPAPFAPHSGSQGQTGGFSTPFCETAVLFVNGIVIPAWSKRAFLLSALWPSGRKSGCGRQPAKSVWWPMASQTLCLPCPAYWAGCSAFGRNTTKAFRWHSTARQTAMAFLPGFHSCTCRI